MSTTLLLEPELGYMMSSASDIILMKCPFCNHDIPALWQQVLISTDEVGRPQQQMRNDISSVLSSEGGGTRTVTVRPQWLKCSNPDCRQILLGVTRDDRTQSHVGGVAPTLHSAETWIAVPKKSNIPQPDPLVTGGFRQDYLEAYSILEDSARMSAVLSRRILADLLNKYEGFDDYKLSKAVDAFVEDKTKPSNLRQNLHYLREIADFSAHSQKDENGAVIAVTREEAEWTLKVIEDLFDYYIIGPEKDKELRAAFDRKLVAANRKAIKPLEEEKE